MRDKKRLEFKKWGTHWIAQLRIFPADGFCPNGYVVTHDRISGGRKAISRHIKQAQQKYGIESIVLDV